LRQVVVGAVAGVVLGGVAALSVAPRLAELRLVSWSVAGGLVGACAVGVSLLVAGLSLRPLATRSAQGLLVVWWALDVALGWRTSPAWALGGSLPFDGLRVATVAWPALLVLLTVVVGVVRVGHLSVEKAWRRSGYADQIRLAVGLNDLRTALLLLRRRTNESPRARPWLTLPSSSGRRPVSQRGVRSLLRWPAARVARFLALAVVTGIVLTAAVFTPAAFVLGVVLVHVAGLDALDALAEELDHPHLLATFPIARGLLVLRHLPVPAALLVGFGLVTATTVTVLSPAAGGLAYGLVPQTVLATVAGGALTASRVAGPLTTLRDMGLPPEVVGPRIVLRVAAPLVPIAMTIVPAVLAFSSGAGVLGSLATSLGGVLVSVGMIAWSALVRR
jgi:hypothetical protein